MKLKMDTIQFESRYEVCDIINALEEWQETHEHDDKFDNVEELIKKLDTICMCW